MSERAIKTYDHYKDLAQRAEYLLLGIVAASIGFFWQTHAPAKLGMNPSTLHLIGLVLLFSAMFVALFRLHRQPFIFALMSDNLDLDSERAALVKSASQGQSVVSGSSGVMHPQDQVARIESIDKRRRLLEERMDEINTLCSRLYAVRNWLLAAGYIVFLAQRIWLPYVTNGS